MRDADEQTCVERDCGWYRTTVALRETIKQLRTDVERLESDIRNMRIAVEHVVGEREKLLAHVERLGADAARLDFLEARAVERGGFDIGFNEAWLSSGPRDFWVNDTGDECGPTLRAAIDAARASSLKESGG